MGAGLTAGPLAVNERPNVRLIEYSFSNPDVGGTYNYFKPMAALCEDRGLNMGGAYTYPSSLLM